MLVYVCLYDRQKNKDHQQLRVAWVSASPVSLSTIWPQIRHQAIRNNTVWHWMVKCEWWGKTWQRRTIGRRLSASRALSRGWSLLPKPNLKSRIRCKATYWELKRKEIYPSPHLTRITAAKMMMLMMYLWMILKRKLCPMTLPQLLRVNPIQLYYRQIKLIMARQASVRFCARP